MTDLYTLRRTAPDCLELVGAPHHPDAHRRGVVVDVVCELCDVEAALVRLARGLWPKVVTP